MKVHLTVERNLKQVSLFQIVIVIAFALSCFFMSSCSDDMSPKELLDGKYYDYESSSDYTFQWNDLKLTVCNVHALTDEEYHHFENCEVTYPVFVHYDDASMTAVITADGGEDEDQLQYYLFQDQEDRFLLIPEQAKQKLFESKRPLAFYLEVI